MVIVSCGGRLLDGKSHTVHPSRCYLDLGFLLRIHIHIPVHLHLHLRAPIVMAIVVVIVMVGAREGRWPRTGARGGAGFATAPGEPLLVQAGRT